MAICGLTKGFVMSGLVGYMLLFLVIGSGFVFIHLVIGKMVRPSKPDAEKKTIYECGEPTIGSAWVQFDLRFYVVALLFVIFDVEVAFFFPWAVVFGKANTLANTRLPIEQRVAVSRELLPNNVSNPSQLPTEAQAADQAEGARQLALTAFADLAVFFGLLLVGFAYLWRRGDLNWVRSTAAERVQSVPVETPQPAPTPEQVLVSAGHE
jgi:NADH-quinone oxidoreductase subunit A